MKASYQPIYQRTHRLTGTVAPSRLTTPAGAAAASGAAALGVTLAGGSAGDLVPVIVLGTAVVEAGAEVTLGAAVEAGAAGKAVPHAEGVIVGRALQAAAGDGALFEMLLIPN